MSSEKILSAYCLTDTHGSVWLAPGGSVMEDMPILGISSCLLGNKVRYDGQHKYDDWLVETLGKYVSYEPVCPEAECGLGIPREAMRLVGDFTSPRLITTNSGIDHTQRMLDYSRGKLEELTKRGLCGYIFKSKSPSSGMERVKVYPPEGGAGQKKGIGIFANEFMIAFPLLPCEEEGRLHDPDLRENFIERIFVMHRWNKLLEGKLNPGTIISFHARHKLLLMAHNPQLYRETGKLVAEVSHLPIEQFLPEYISLIMKAMSFSATRSKHQNVLQHILGYFKNDLNSSEKAEMLELIESYKARFVPLIVPVTLLNHYVRKYDKQYLAEQYYLNPHPMELALRNHV